MLCFGTQTRSDGSATCRMGKSESVSGVIGPVESRFADDRVEGIVEVAYKNVSSAGFIVGPGISQDDLDAALLIKEALEACIKSAPRTTVSVSTRVLADEGCGLTAAMLSSVGALVNAGVPLLSIPVLVEVVVAAEGGALSVDPTAEAKASARAVMTMVFAGRSPSEEEDGPVAWRSHGRCSARELQDAMRLARNHSLLLRDSVERALVQFVTTNRDLTL